jgi:hypothetical protein
LKRSKMMRREAGCAMREARCVKTGVDQEQRACSGRAASSVQLAACSVQLAAYNDDHVHSMHSRPSQPTHPSRAAPIHCHATESDSIQPDACEMSDVYAQSERW